MNAKYKLLKDLPDSKMGDIYEYSSTNKAYYKNGDLTDSYWLKANVENSPEWFAKIEENIYTQSQLNNAIENAFHAARLIDEKISKKGYSIEKHFVYKDADHYQSYHHIGTYAVQDNTPLTGTSTIDNPQFDKRKENENADIMNAVFKILKKDADYYYAWQANIAMAFKDQYSKEAVKVAHSELWELDIHKIANQAAKNFLDLLIKELNC